MFCDRSNKRGDFHKIGAGADYGKYFHCKSCV
jgi:hypothetical protein